MKNIRQRYQIAITGSNILITIVALITSMIAISLINTPEVFGDFARIRQYLLELQVIIWGFTLLTYFPESRPYRLLQHILWIPRQKPVLWWLLLLLFSMYQIGQWIIQHDPVMSNLSAIEPYRIAAAIWSMVYIVLFDLENERAAIIGQKLARTPLTNVMITLTVLAGMLILAELTLRWIPPISDGGNLTLMGKQWMNQYWQPINALEYRDYPIHENLSPNRKTIFITGDSFAAGHGVADFDDTFGQVLAGQCGASCAVNQVAVPGWASQQQLDALNQYPASPDILVLAYMMNDIQDSVMGALRVVTATPPHSPLDYWRDEFYLGSFLWYLSFADNNYTNYYGQMFGGYEDSAIWERHTQELQGFVDYAAQEDAQLVVLLWHFIQFPDESRPGITQVKQYFEEQDIPVINMLDRLPYDTVPISDMIASPIDPHPSVLSHRYAGDALYEVIQPLLDE